MKSAEGPGIEAAELPADPVPRRRPADAERRQELIQAAEAVFLQQGFAAANMDHVARGAGMSKKTLYQLFPSKEALFEAVIWDHLTPLIAFTPEEEGDDPRSSLTALLLMAAERLLDWKHIGMFRLVSSEGRRSPELAQAFHRVGPGRGEGSLERCIAAHARKGKLQVEDASDALRHGDRQGSHDAGPVPPGAALFRGDRRPDRKGRGDLPQRDRAAAAGPG